MATHFQTFVNAFDAAEKKARALDDNDILCPPVENFGYRSTPMNALTFASMGVDGVHWAVLKRNGEVRDDSPVVCISPMDSESVFILAESFISFLADGCGVSVHSMQEIFDAEHSGQKQLVAFLQKHFACNPLLGEERLERLTAQYKHLIEPR